MALTLKSVANEMPFKRLLLLAFLLPSQFGSAAVVWLVGLPG